MKKLIIQIPSFNEEATLKETVASLPRRIPTFDRTEVLIIDDGSKDRTVQVARAAGVEHIISFPRNLGLAAAFTAGIAEARPHVGESLVPSSTRVFNELNFIEQMEQANFPHKYGAAWTADAQAKTYDVNCVASAQASDFMKSACICGMP